MEVVQPIMVHYFLLATRIVYDLPVVHITWGMLNGIKKPTGAYELLDDSLFYAMPLHYNRVVHFNAQYMRYTLETEDIVMP